MVRPVAWSKKGKASEVEVSTQQGTNLSVLGCMSWYGLLALSQQVPKPIGSKKCKIVSKDNGLPHGTSSSHFLLFFQEISSVSKNLGLESMYIVMDNATIHKTSEVLQAICNNGHISPFLPPYSPFLHPIEECWAKIKAKKAAKTVSAKDCKGYIRHSQRHFAQCSNMERI
ncbi:hypothetical protein INT45_004941 [Circinella minor]|uniref:Tc1-like transposase DDE domain-containing protein n=1 Tax=Circinella minor TaxID=1195481 RepID=A0A8H7VKL5_9FUNG|nr:hypothetical protein INT45_004941 [Circinella minor]